MSRTRARAVIGAVAIGSLLGSILSGCVPEAAAPAPDPSAPSLTASQFQDAGITIVDDDAEGLDDPVGFQLTQMQVDRMIEDAARENGLTGAELDQLAPVTDGAPPISYVVAAWVSTSDLPGAAAAETQFSDPDWTKAQEQVFPLAVVALFVGDIMTLAAQVPVQTAPAALSDEASIGPVALAADGPCTAVTGLLTSVITRVFDVLRLLPTAIGSIDALGLAGAALAALIGVALDLAQGVIVGIVSTLTEQVFSVVRLAVGALGVATVIASYFSDQSLTVTAAPGSHQAFSVDPAPRNTGSLRAEAKALADGWPPAVRDCAEAAGAKLPTAIRSGDTANWALASGASLLELDSTTSKVDAKASTTVSFVTGHEDEETAKGNELTKTARVSVQIPRSEVGDFLDLAVAQVDSVRSRILDKVPAILRDQVAAVLTAVLDPVIASVRASAEGLAGGVGILSLRGTGLVFVTFHAPKEPTPTPTAEPEDPGDDDGEFCRQFAVQAGAAATALEGASDPFSWAATFAAGLETIDATPPAAIAGDFAVAVGFYHLAGQSSYENAQSLADFVAANDVDGARARLWEFCGVAPLPTQ